MQKKKNSITLITSDFGLNRLEGVLHDLKGHGFELPIGLRVKNPVNCDLIVWLVDGVLLIKKIPLDYISKL